MLLQFPLSVHTNHLFSENWNATITKHHTYERGFFFTRAAITVFCFLVAMKRKFQHFFLCAHFFSGLLLKSRTNVHIQHCLIFMYAVHTLNTYDHVLHNIDWILKWKGLTPDCGLILNMYVPCIASHVPKYTHIPHLIWINIFGKRPGYKIRFLFTCVCYNFHVFNLFSNY